MENRPAPLRSRRVCRFCLTDNEPLNFIYDRELSRPLQVPLTLQIMSCVAIEVYSADGMPQMICGNCRSNLDRCYKFKQQCKKADEALRAYPVSGVLPRAFPPISSDSLEIGTKRNADSKPSMEQSKKIRLDNGDRDRREAPHPTQRQIETRAEKQQREQDSRRDLFDEEEQDGNSDGEHEANNTKPESKLEPGEIRVHACNQCDRTFPLLQSLQIHIQRAHRDRDYKCTECDRMFFSKYDLSKHMTTHTEEKPYSCQICQKQFSRANLLQRHEKIHREQLRYGCPHCDREFFTPEELEKHEEAVHKAVKPFQCNICNKRFTYKQGLERHEILHNEDKSFVCEYCKEAFRTSTKLARHLTTHAGHRPYLCKLCPRSFLLSHHLTRHMRTHSVEKRHQCEDCDKAFKRKESLEVHQLTHVKRPSMGLVCDVCQESCRNRADYVTHIKQHIEAGEKMGPDGIPPESKDKMADTESEEEDEEEQYSDDDDDYEPPSSYIYSQKVQKTSKPKTKSEDEAIEKEESKEQIVYVRGKDGNVMKKTIKTLMPIQRRSEQSQESKPKSIQNSPQIVNSKQIKHDDIGQSSQLGQKVKVDETEAQVQKIVASVFKEHKIPLKHQEQTKDSVQTTQRQSSITPNIIKEEKLDVPLTTVTQKNVNTVKVIKRIVMRKPTGSADSIQTVISPSVKELVQEANPGVVQQLPVAPSTSGTKTTKRVIVRRIIRQGDKMREVIMNPDGTLIDPAELAKLPTGNVVKRVVVKKPLDKGQNIEQMLQSADAKQIIKLAESGGDLVKASSLITTPKIITQIHRVEHPLPQQKQLILQDDHETKQKLEQLEKRVEQQRLKIEELQARKQQEYEACDEMIPERHDESEDEQQLPLKRVFVKRNKSIYDEEREYNDEKEKENEEDATVMVSNIPLDVTKEEDLSQSSETFEEKFDKAVSPSRSIEEAKIIIIKPEENQPDVDEMSRELCNILDSTETVVKMQENVLNNLTQITSIDETSAHKTYAEVDKETTEQDEERLEEVGATPTISMMDVEHVEHVEQEVISDDVQQIQEQVEEGNDQQERMVKIIITHSQEDGNVNLQFENNQMETTEVTTVERNDSELTTLTTQEISASNDIFETSDATIEIEEDKNHEPTSMDDSVIELSNSNENIHETNDSRDSLEDKLSQMEG